MTCAKWKKRVNICICCGICKNINLLQRIALNYGQTGFVRHIELFPFNSLETDDYFAVTNPTESLSITNEHCVFNLERGDSDNYDLNWDPDVNVLSETYLTILQLYEWKSIQHF